MARIVYIVSCLILFGYFAYKRSSGEDLFSEASKERKPSGQSRLYHK